MAAVCLQSRGRVVKCRGDIDGQQYSLLFPPPQTLFSSHNTDTALTASAINAATVLDHLPLARGEMCQQ